jgi:hypothetical protein
MPSAQVHIVDGGHFSLVTAQDEIAPRVCEFNGYAENSSGGIHGNNSNDAGPSPFASVHRERAIQKVRASPKMAGTAAIRQK